MSETRKARFFGLVLFTAGAILIAGSWYIALSIRQLPLLMAFAGPFFLPAGLFLLVTGKVQPINHSSKVKVGLATSGLVLGFLNVSLIVTA